MYAYIHAYMTKVISLSDDAYESLKSMKTEGESFSEVVRRISLKSRSVLDFFGAWPDKKELDKISKELKKERAAFKTREVKF